MTEVLIPIAAIGVLILLLGLPLLLKPDSAIPEIVSCGILTVIVLGFAWMTGDWWVLIPVLALVGLVVWLDRGRPGSPPGEDRMGDRARARFRLWRIANRAGLILIAAAIILQGTGTYLIPAEILAGLVLISVVASTLFRFSYYRVRRRNAASGPQ